MFYRTSQRFISNTTVVSTKLEHQDIKIESYKTNTKITNENLEKPFKQIENIFKTLHKAGDNSR